MAESLEWVKWEPKRWLTSEARMMMTPTERSIYLDLLFCQFVQGSLPDNQMVLANLANVPQDVFDEAWKSMENRFEKRDGRLIQPYANKVRQHAIDRVNTLRINGLKGGRPRKNQKGNQNKTKRVTKTKPKGPIRASSSLSLGFMNKDIQEEQEQTEVETIWFSIRSGHPKGRNNKPREAEKQFGKKFTKAAHYRVMLRHHEAWRPIWEAGQGCPELFRWIRDFDPAADLPRPAIRQDTVDAARERYLRGTA